LEAFISAFGGGERLYDPTGVFSEADRLVAFARALRGRLATGLKGVFWNSRLRTVYVLLEEGSFADAYFVFWNKLTAAEQAVIQAFESTSGQDPQSQSIALHSVRLCFDVPAVPLVPIDAASKREQQIGGGIQLGLRRLRELATLAKVPLISALLGLGSASTAAASQSVIDNTQMLITADNREVHSLATADIAGLRGTGTAVGSPLETPESQALLSDGLHMLWRDPIRGPIGTNTSYDEMHSALESLAAKLITGVDDERRISREHFSQFAEAGISFGAHGQSAAREAELDLAWLSRTAAAAEEAQDLNRRPSLYALQSGVAAIPGLTSFASGDFSDEAYDAILQHLQVYFGSPRALQDEAQRHTKNAAPSRQNGDAAERKILLAQAQTYWEWLQNNRQSNPGGGYNAPGPRNDLGNRTYRGRSSSY